MNKYLLLFALINAPLYAQSVGPAIIGTTPGTAIDNAQIGSPNGVAQLDTNTKILASALVNRPQITPLTTTVGTTATAIFNAEVFLGVDIAVLSGGNVACTFDGTTPVLGTPGLYPPAAGTSLTTAQYYPDLVLNSQDFGLALMPAGPVLCIASVTSTISAGAK